MPRASDIALPIALPRILLALSLSLSAFGQGEPEIDFETEIRPILAARCFGCHGEEKQKGKVRLDTLSTDLVADRAAGETWHDALDALQVGEMPPEDEEPLTDAERKALTGWIRQQIDAAIAAAGSLPRSPVIRRLNRTEYQNTMRDLLGIDLAFASDLPPDPPSSDGFLNNGAALPMSGLQLELFLEAARKGLARTIVSGERPQMHEAQFTKPTTNKWPGGKRVAPELGRGEVFPVQVQEFPREGEFVVRVRARKLPAQANDLHPRLRVSVGLRADVKVSSILLGEADVKSTEAGGEVLEFRGRIEAFPLPTMTQSKYPGLALILENAFDDGTKLPKPPKKKKGQKQVAATPEPQVPHIAIEEVAFEGPIFDAWPPAHHRAIVGPGASHDRARIEQIVGQFLRRAWRRQVTKAEITSLADFFTESYTELESFEEALRETLSLALISPQFLYLVEPDKAAGEPLTDFELASRLSYFLWSTMPDRELFSLAHRSELSRPEILEAQVKRLLLDPRSAGFVEGFADQWLDLGAVDRVAVNPQFYPNFNNDLKAHMKQETREFLGHILRTNLSALHLLKTNFALLNAPLAMHYGLEGPRGGDFVRVKLEPEEQAIRGGILTHGSILLGNSTGEDSHPIKRAVWIRERLLHDPPAPPPPNVPALDATNPDFAKLGIREQMEIHREDPACADCHRDIDPWGLALEHYDAVGSYRTEIERKAGKKKLTLPVDARTELPGKKIIDGLEGLQTHLLEDRRDEFAEALVQKILSYGLGRSLTFEDSPTVEALTEEFEKDGFRLGGLVLKIATHEGFRQR